MGKNDRKNNENNVVTFHAVMTEPVENKWKITNQKPIYMVNSFKKGQQNKTRLK